MPVYHEKKFILVHVWKTGGTSLAHALESYYGFKPMSSSRVRRAFNAHLLRRPDPYAKHAYAVDIRRVLGMELFDQYLSVAFVRNPWDWLVSWYSFVLGSKVSPDTGKAWRHHLYSQVHGKTFPEFIGWVTEQNGLAGSFLRKRSSYKTSAKVLQRDWIFDHDGKRIVDYVGRYETLQQDFENICERLGIDARSLDKQNVSKRSSYRDYYTSQTRKMVERYFQEDIDTFEYQF